jgi:hypothetical protein
MYVNKSFMNWQHIFYRFFYYYTIIYQRSIRKFDSTRTFIINFNDQFCFVSHFFLTQISNIVHKHFLIALDLNLMYFNGMKPSCFVDLQVIIIEFSMVKILNHLNFLVQFFAIMPILKTFQSIDTFKYQSSSSNS